METDIKARIDPEVAELIAVLRNSTKTPGSVFDRAAGWLESLAVDNAQLLGFTSEFMEHVEGYEGPCECAECRVAHAPDHSVMA
jgi:hypothetical protein